MSKRILSALLICAALASLASCSNDSADTTVGQTTADTAVESTADTDGAKDTDGANETEASGETNAPAETNGAPDAPASDNSAAVLLNTLKEAGENMTLANVYDSTNSPLSAINFVSSFGGEIDFDENFEPIYPEIMNKIEEYAFLMPVGKSPIEIDVFKVKDAADVDAVKDLCEDRIKKIKESDIKVYSPDECDRIFPLMTVYAKGSYVMMISVENPDAVKAAADAAITE